MTEMPKKCLFDLNVPITANLAAKPEIDLDILNLIEHIKQEGGLVIDEDGEIVMEYLNNLPQTGQPGLMDAFVKWVHDNQGNIKKVERVKITKNGETYDEFPQDECLAVFDFSSRKYIAAANAHSDKPPVIQAFDPDYGLEFRDDFIKDLEEAIASKESIPFDEVKSVMS